MDANSDGSKTKDRWDKIDIFFKPLGGFITGISIVFLGYYTTNLLNNHQAQEASIRLYSEMMISREKADSDLRKEMFNSIIKAFLKPDNEAIEQKVLALELLAFNFHDVIDISSLFKYVAKSIGKSNSENKNLLTEQLERLSSEVIEKQLASLRNGGIVKEISLFVNFNKDVSSKSGGPFNDIKDIIVPIRLDESNNQEVRLDESNNQEGRYIFVQVLQRFDKAKEIEISLDSGLIAPNKERGSADIDTVFKIGLYDFPVIDNIRVNNSQRIAVVMTRWSEDHAEIALAYFPASHASLKDKPYYNEIIDQLNRTKAILTKKDGMQNDS